jgi:hypothetical protein
MLNKLIFSRKHILKPLLEQLKTNSNDENVRRMQELQKQLESHAEKKNTLHRLYAQKAANEVVLNNVQSAHDHYYVAYALSLVTHNSSLTEKITKEMAEYHIAPLQVANDA